nr:AAA family ATPase [Corallincola sp.]
MAGASLFSPSPASQPLAARMRPRTLDEYAGQQHLLAAGKPLRRALEAGQIHSMILWGPPGTGKTTLAELFARWVDAEVLRLSAVTSGVKEIREAVALAEQLQLGGRRVVLFVDEVHRFNKAQQDAFLPHIESGLLVFIGAT